MVVVPPCFLRLPLDSPPDSGIFEHAQSGTRPDPISAHAGNCEVWQLVATSLQQEMHIRILEGGPFDESRGYRRRSAALASAEVLATYNFTSADNLEGWKTGLYSRWDKRTPPDQITVGRVSWSDEFEGTAKMTVDGAPSGVHLWRDIPCALQFGDQMVVKFHTLGTLRGAANSICSSMTTS